MFFYLSQSSVQKLALIFRVTITSHRFSFLACHVDVGFSIKVWHQLVLVPLYSIWVQIHIRDSHLNSTCLNWPRLQESRCTLNYWEILITLVFSVDFSTKGHLHKLLKKIVRELEEVLYTIPIRNKNGRMIGSYSENLVLNCWILPGYYTV